MDEGSRARQRRGASLLAVVAVVALSQMAWAEGGHGGDLLRWDVMHGNLRPFVGAAGNVRGVNAGGLPWVVGEASGRLRADGELQVDVRGLVIDPKDPAAIASGNAGTNPSPSFRAIVSCLSVDPYGVRVEVNVVSKAFPATPDGNAYIRDDLKLPSPCLAPIVFVTNANGTSWFAVTGH
jgi:hypothetical protein